MSTMIQLGEVRRYKAGERVPWWCMFQRPCFKGWPRFGRMTFACDVEISLDHQLAIHVRPVSEGPHMVRIELCRHMRIGPPGRGAEAWFDLPALTAVAAAVAA